MQMVEFDISPLSAIFLRYKITLMSVSHHMRMLFLHMCTCICRVESTSCFIFLNGGCLMASSTGSCLMDPTICCPKVVFWKQHKPPSESRGQCSVQSSSLHVKLSTEGYIHTLKSLTISLTGPYLISWWVEADLKGVGVRGVDSRIDSHILGVMSLRREERKSAKKQLLKKAHITITGLHNKSDENKSFLQFIII